MALFDLRNLSRGCISACHDKPASSIASSMQIEETRLYNSSLLLSMYLTLFKKRFIYKRSGKANFANR